jgi:hypothetical protein
LQGVVIRIVAPVVDDILPVSFADAVDIIPCAGIEPIIITVVSTGFAKDIAYLFLVSRIFPIQSLYSFLQYS